MADRMIELKNLTKRYDGETALDGINLYIRRREFLTLLGPSGCGKTTMLRLIAGFEQADEGDILFEGKRINDVPPYKRRVNTVFQRYSLFPHLSVFDNGLRPVHQAHAQAADPRPGGGDARAGGPGGVWQAPARLPFGRTAAAGGHRPGAGQRPGGAAAG